MDLGVELNAAEALLSPHDVTGTRAIHYPPGHASLRAHLHLSRGTFGFSLWPPREEYRRAFSQAALNSPAPFKLINLAVQSYSPHLCLGSSLWIIMRRSGKLVACCSTAVSIAAVVAGSLFAALDHPSKAPTALSRMADQLPILLDQGMGGGVAYFIRLATSGGFQLGQGRKREAANVKSKSGNQTVAAAVVLPRASDKYADVNTTGSTGSPTASRSDVVWLFDERGGPPLFALSRDDKGAKVNGFLISGKNTSDHPLTEVQGLLKPESGDGNLELNLSLGGNTTDENVRTIPPGAQFSLVYTFPTALSANGSIEKFGGMVFAFHYTHAGIEKAIICYFSASRFRTDLQNVETAPSLLPQRSTLKPVRPSWAAASELEVNRERGLTARGYAGSMKF
jgi:hypothetical protein